MTNPLLRNTGTGMLVLAWALVSGWAVAMWAAVGTYKLWRWLERTSRRIERQTREVG